ncbi:MAG: hypothetical protein HZC02_04400 [Candidatus Levybacteria bacterium]|nr:hypothetical protein [Candidatus Levybacteria bacterium]
MSKALVFINKWSIGILIAITLLAAILRIYHLDQVPIGFHADEAYFGYNAYSISKSLQDATGNVLPLHLESFLYSPAGYSYIAIPSIVFFGLTSFAIRLPGALFGIATIFFVFFLIKELYKDQKHNNILGIVVSSLLAISPWHINLSRASAEIVVVVFLIMLGTFFYSKWVDQGKKLFISLSFIFFTVSYVFYQAPRAFLPLFIPILFLLYRPKISAKKLAILIGAYTICIVLPVVMVLTSDVLSYRLKMLSIFNSPRTNALLFESITEDGHRQRPVAEVRLFHNKVAGYASEVFTGYMKHLSYDFLFTDQGFPDRYRIPKMGLLYIFELPLLLIGIYSIIRNRHKIGFLSIAWILIGFVGASLTYDDIPNLQRTLIIFPALHIIIGFGLFYLFTNIPKRYLARVSIACICVVFYFFFYYLHQYYSHQFIHKPIYRQQGYEGLVNAIQQELPSYKSIHITSNESSPLILFLFYLSYDPRVFHAYISSREHNYLNEDFGKISLDKYIFIPEDCPSEKNTDPLILSVDLGKCGVSDKKNVVKEIMRSDGSVIFRLVKTGQTQESL